MDRACTSQDQRKRRTARISSSIKRILCVFDQLFFPRECAHCTSLLQTPKERLCKACLDLLDPSSASFGCKACLKSLEELGEEKVLKSCSCKELPLFSEVIYLEPKDGILQSLIQSKALQEEPEVCRAISAYLIQIAFESNQPMPKRILVYASSKEEKLLQSALEKILKIKKTKGDLFCQKSYLQTFFLPWLKRITHEETIWILGLKKKKDENLYWKRTIPLLQAKEVVLFFVSCS